MSNLQFLTLMTGLEVLFVESNEEKISKIVSRNTAIIVGDRSNGEEIYNNMQSLYKTRSNIVHSGNRELKNKDNLLLLRDYLRKSIKEMNVIIEKEPHLHGDGGKIDLKRFKDDKDYKNRPFKQNISYLLYSCGFGDKPWYD